jgi:hypothetical protein
MTKSLIEQDKKNHKRVSPTVTQSSVTQSSRVSQTPSSQTVQRAQIDPQRLTPADVSALQRSIGNSAVADLLSSRRSASPSGGQSAGQPVAQSAAPSVQRKLDVGPADDRYEREADKLAASVVKGAGSTTSSAVTASGSVQRAAVGLEGGALSSNTESRLRQSQGSGSALPGSVRSALEPKLGADLSSVKVHTDSSAVQLSQEMGAKAFTHQNHIYYGKGHSPSDLKLTAHEAVHTIQQGAVSQTPQRKQEV